MPATRKKRQERLTKEEGADSSSSNNSNSNSNSLRRRHNSGSKSSNNSFSFYRFYHSMMGSVTWNVRALVAAMTVASLGLVLLVSLGAGAPEGGGAAILNALATGAGLATDWKAQDYLSEPLPKEVEDFAREKGDGYRVDERTVEVDDEGHKVFYRECHPASVLPETGKTVLLLHGQAFTSETWQAGGLKTMQTLAALGHRVVAVDLPGKFMKYFATLKTLLF